MTQAPFGMARTARVAPGAGSNSTSPQVMPRTSPERAAVRVRNCNARAPIPSRWASSFHQRDALASATAGRCSVSFTFDGLGRSSAKFPRQRAGLSTVRCPATVA